MNIFSSITIIAMSVTIIFQTKRISNLNESIRVYDQMIRKLGKDVGYQEKEKQRKEIISKMWESERKRRDETNCQSREFHKVWV